MPPVQLPGRLERLGTGAEQHGVDDTKGRMETADRIVQQVGMLRERRRDPGVSQLQQRRPARA
jgi:hypothetical protein